MQENSLRNAREASRHNGVACIRSRMQYPGVGGVAGQRMDVIIDPTIKINHVKTLTYVMNLMTSQSNERFAVNPHQLQPHQPRLSFVRSCDLRCRRLRQVLYLRPIYTEDVPGVILFVLLRRVILRSCTARQLLGAIKQTKNRARLLLATFQCRLALRRNSSDSLKKDVV